MATEKMKGKIMQAGAALRGDTGILNTLVGEHEEVDTLMQKVATKNGDSSAMGPRRKLFPEIKKNLVLHAHAEQEIFYRACEKRTELKDLVSHSWAEHEEVEKMLRALDELDIESAEWHERFLVLQEEVRHHVGEEHDKIFPRSKDVFSRDELKTLDQRYKEMKKQLEGQVDQLLYGAEAGRKTA